MYIILFCSALQPHRSTRFSDVVTLPLLSAFLFPSEGQQSLFRSCITLSLESRTGVSFPKNFASMPTDYSHLISHTSARHCLHHHCHHQLLLLSSTPCSCSKLIFSTNFLNSTHRTAWLYVLQLFLVFLGHVLYCIPLLYKLTEQNLYYIQVGLALPIRCI